MTSYTDCTPFDENNVVPGDSYDIGQLAAHYRNTAQEISAQASQLRRLANSAAGGAWGGDSGKTFTSKASDLATSIEKVHGRYDEAAKVLQAWSDEIDHLQSAVGTLAEQGRTLTTTISQNQPAPTVPNAPAPTDAEATAAKTTAKNLSDAQASLETTRRNYEKAVQAYKDAAKAQGDKLRSVADHDSVHDSTWDKIKGFVSEHAGIINKILKWVTYAVTALAIAALVISLFIPGVDAFTGAALLMTLGAWADAAATGGTVLLLAAQSLMASTGNGSWTDVAVDLVALASAGTSRVLTKVGGDALKSMKGLEGPAGEAAFKTAKDAFDSAHAGSTALWKTVDRIPGLRTLLSSGSRLTKLAAGADKAGSEASDSIREIIKTGEFPSKFGQRLAGFGSEATRKLAALQEIDRLAPGVGDITSTISKLEHSMPTLKNLGVAALTTDSLNHAQQDLFGKTGLGGASKWIESHTTRQLPFKLFTPPQVAMGATAGGGE